MRTSFKTLIIGAVAAIALPLSAQADNHLKDEGVYFGLGAGVNFPLDSDVNGGPHSYSADWDTGWTGVTSIGYGFGNGWRTEFEGGYRHNNNDDSGQGNNAKGDISVWSLMGNVYYDFDIKSRWTPYLGAGVGVAWLSPDNVGPINSGGTDVWWNENSDGFAYQLMTGIAYDLNERTKLTLNYKFFGTPNHGANASDTTSVDMEYHTHDVLLGVRFKLGSVKEAPKAEPVPEPAPVVEVAPEPVPEPAPVVERVRPQNFLVFFNFANSTLTPEAKRIVQTAAQNYQESGAARIELTGHADKSGASAFNLALSKKRAKAVAAELIASGIAADSIAVYARGESMPLVPTADGVREPQNRRVEIIMEQ